MGANTMMDIDKILDETLGQFEKFDGSIESAIDIIESNQIRVDRLKELFSNKDVVMTEEYASKMESVVTRQQKLLNLLGIEKEDLLNKMDQVNKKNKVVNSYMTTKTNPIFIDKDM